MIDLVVKLLIVMFTLAVGGCFAIWPEDVSRRFRRWRGRNIKSANDQRMSTREIVDVLWFRQMGVLLIALTCYVVYLWIRTE